MAQKEREAGARAAECVGPVQGSRLVAQLATHGVETRWGDAPYRAVGESVQTDFVRLPSPVLGPVGIHDWVAFAAYGEGEDLVA